MKEPAFNCIIFLKKQSKLADLEYLIFLLHFHKNIIGFVRLLASARPSPETLFSLVHDFPCEMNSFHCAWSPCQLLIFLFFVCPKLGSIFLSVLCTYETDISSRVLRKLQMQYQGFGDSWISVASFLAIKYLNYLWHIIWKHSGTLYPVKDKYTARVKMNSYK